MSAVARKTPNLSPQEKRAKLIVSNLLTLRARGIDPDVRDVEKMVIAECELVDAATRAGELGGTTPAKRDPMPNPARVDELAKAQQETGTRLIVDRDLKPDNAPHRYRPAVLHQNPMQRSARYAAAVARIGRTLEGVMPATSLERAVKFAEYRVLARAYLELYAFYMTRQRPAPILGRADHNPFRNLSDRDAARKWEAMLYAICDRSTSEPGLGSWYVK